MAVAAVRAGYELYPDGTLRLAARQEIVLSDAYEGSTHATPLVMTSDLAPFKPGADITILGSAHPPGGEPAAVWPVSVAIDGATRELRIHGPRQWEPGRKGDRPVWSLTPARRVAEVALDWRLASGGRIIGDPKGDAHPRNPIGAGLVDPRVTSPYFAYDAPQIDSAAEPVGASGDRPEPQGFGPVPPAWACRLRHLGTPEGTRLPADHDYRYWHNAPPALRLPAPLGAGARVRLSGLVPGGGALVLALPDIEPYAHFAHRDGRDVFAAMNRDGLHLDLRGQPPWRADITFRCWFEICPQFQFVSIGVTDAAGAAGLPVAGRDGLQNRGGGT